MRNFIFSILFLSIVTASYPTHADSPPSDEIPKHLAFTREILNNVKPENNHYAHKDMYVRFPTDLFSSTYVSNTGCISFVEEMLNRAYGTTFNFNTTPKQRIAEFVNRVDKGELFKKIFKVSELKPGDYVAWKYMGKVKESNLLYAGHIVTVDTIPVKSPSEFAESQGLQRWELWIIDSSDRPASPDDTRYLRGKNEPVDSKTGFNELMQGLGRGRIYLYSDKDGNLQGMSYAFKSSKLRPQNIDFFFVMARPQN